MRYWSRVSALVTTSAGASSRPARLVRPRTTVRVVAADECFTPPLLLGRRNQTSDFRLREAFAEEVPRDVDDFVEPDRLEDDFGVEVVHLLEHRIVDARIARDDGNRNVAGDIVRAQAVEEPDAVHERHPQVEEDRVGPGLLDFPQAGPRPRRPTHLV